MHELTNYVKMICWSMCTKGGIILAYNYPFLLKYGQRDTYNGAMWLAQKKLPQLFTHGLTFCKKFCTQFFFPLTLELKFFGAKLAPGLHF
jgi:hypothetical protein